MNPIMKFYTGVLAYIRTHIETEGAVENIIVLAEKASPSWKATTKRIRFLERCVNRASTVVDEEAWSKTKNDFAKAAFKDLSALKNPEAMELFRKIAEAVVPTLTIGEDVLVWARSVKERPDGSAVLVLHVSDLKRFRTMIENHDLVDNSTESGGRLEDVVQIAS